MIKQAIPQNLGYLLHFLPLSIVTGLRNVLRAVVTAMVCPAASITEFRDSNLLKGLRRLVMLVTVHPATSSQSSESRFQYPNFRILSVLERDPLDGPSWVPLSQPVFPEIKSAAQND